MIWIGIDPGKKGGYAWISQDAYLNDRVVTKPFDEKMFIADMKVLVRRREEKRCCLEKVHSMPKQGLSSTFTFGSGYGFLKGVLETLDISYQEITPQRWKGEFGLNSDKQKSNEACKKLFPMVCLLPTARCKKDSDGMSEALLMAEYARRKL